jgi:hypothetical protein
MLLFEWASRIETAGFKLVEGKHLPEGSHSKELWKSVENQKRRVLNRQRGSASSLMFAALR